MSTKFFVSMSTAETPTSGPCVVDEWWFVDRERGLLFYMSSDAAGEPYAMCNPDRNVHVSVSGAQGWNETYDIVRVPVVYLGHASIENSRLHRERKSAA